MNFSVENDYTFNQMGRIGYDNTDATQRQMQNTKYSTSVLSNYFSDKLSDSHVQFATAHPGVFSNGMNGGFGLSGIGAENESSLFWGMTQERSLEKLQLMERPFLTVPYLGKGSCNPLLESQLQQGETVRGKKSVSTVMEQNFMNPQTYPMDSDLAQRVQNPAFSVEEAALQGWVRGGSSTRESGDKYQNGKPIDTSY
jgi:hypothetical protein